VISRYAAWLESVASFESRSTLVEGALPDAEIAIPKALPPVQLWTSEVTSATRYELPCVTATVLKTPPKVGAVPAVTPDSVHALVTGARSTAPLTPTRFT
jgi:hypothetical protein